MTVIEQQELAFSVGIQRTPAGVRVTVEGELDLATAPHLEAALERVVVENGQTPVVMDLSEVAFLDAAGWRAVSNVASALEGRGGPLIVAEASGPVRRFMELIGDHRLELAPDGEE